jgi:hypothetical protein
MNGIAYCQGLALRTQVAVSLEFLVKTGVILQACCALASIIQTFWVSVALAKPR